MAVRRLSDLLCAEYGLSVIENPKPSKGRNYGAWLGGDKPQSWSEKIRRKIDEVLPDCKTFDAFLAALRAAGFTVNADRKYVSVLAPGQKRATRIKSLGDDYTETAIRAWLGKVEIIASSGDSGTRNAPSLLIDIQQKICEGKGAGYEQWAKIFNLQQAAKTLIFLQENGIDSYEDLKKKSSSASGEFTALNSKIKEVETRHKEVAELQKYIGQYGKTKDVYAQYKASGWSARFFEEHRTEITLHKAAKKYFDGLGAKKLPSINQLKQEYAALAAERKKLYAGFRELKENSRALAVAKGNADHLLGITPQTQPHDVSRDQLR
jgi:hypothetical protein